MNNPFSPFNQTRLSFHVYVAVSVIFTTRWINTQPDPSPLSVCMTLQSLPPLFFIVPVMFLFTLIYQQWQDDISHTPAISVWSLFWQINLSHNAKRPITAQKHQSNTKVQGIWLVICSSCFLWSAHVGSFFPAGWVKEENHHELINLHKMECCVLQTYMNLHVLSAGQLMLQLPVSVGDERSLADKQHRGLL